MTLANLTMEILLRFVNAPCIEKLHTEIRQGPHESSIDDTVIAGTVVPLLSV